MLLEILNSDKFFSNSPDAGEPDCECSRCRRLIKEGEKIFRQPVSSDQFVAFNVNTGEEKELKDGADGYEFRLCPVCVETIRQAIKKK